MVDIMIGQNDLANLINSLVNSNEFPRTSLIVGESGSGKHLMTDWIARKLHIDAQDITKDISLELITEIGTRNYVSLYLINCSDITEKDENVILKFIEEPPMSAYIVLLAETKQSVIPTVFNRCHLFEMAKYTDENLMNFLGRIGYREELSRFIPYIRTPGQLEKLRDSDPEAMETLVKQIFEAIGSASLSNIIYKLPMRFWESKKKSKKKSKETPVYMDFDIFVKMMVHYAYELVIQSDDDRLVKIYDLTTKLDRDRTVLHVDKYLLFENYLTNLKHLVVGA